jgi:hypothetical protein
MVACAPPVCKFPTTSHEEAKTSRLSRGGLIKSSKCLYEKSVMHLYIILLCKSQVRRITTLYSYHPLANIPKIVNAFTSNLHSVRYNANALHDFK